MSRVNPRTVLLAWSAWKLVRQFLPREEPQPRRRRMRWVLVLALVGAGAAGAAAATWLASRRKRPA